MATPTSLATQGFFGVGGGGPSTVVVISAFSATIADSMTATLADQITGSVSAQPLQANLSVSLSAVVDTEGIYSEL